jgi:hypothetical protein
VYDFIEPEQGKVSPYGVYELSKNQGWVSVGISGDTGSIVLKCGGFRWE